MGECRKITVSVNRAIATFRTLPASETVASYALDWEHLMDELRRLDLLIRLRLLREPYQKPASLLDQFQGLVLSDEEIARLLADSGRQHADNAFLNHESQEQQALVQALNQLEEHMQQRLAAGTQEAVYLSLPSLAQLFHLTRFEEQCLIMCLAPELD